MRLQHRHIPLPPPPPSPLFRLGYGWDVEVTEKGSDNHAAHHQGPLKAGVFASISGKITTDKNCNNDIIFHTNRWLMKVVDFLSSENE